MIAIIAAPIAPSPPARAVRRARCVANPKQLGLALHDDHDINAAPAKALDAAPRLPLLDEAAARAVVSEALPPGPLPLWAGPVANFPRERLNRVNAKDSGLGTGDWRIGWA